MYGFSLFRNSSDANHQSKEGIIQPNIPNLFPVLRPEKLLDPHVQYLKTIEELAGVSKNHFDQYYLKAIKHFARFVQQLLASEVHHHAGPGGMLAHGLEVCVAALKIRRSYLLSSSGGAEEISLKQDLWTYAIFTGALCHDLGKPAVHQQVTLYDGQGNESTWNPWTDFMDEKGHWYTQSFVRNRSYRLHEKSSPLLIHRIIPESGVAWLASDHLIFSQWLASLSGNRDEAGAMGDIIHQADKQSVAKNLGADTVKTPGVRTKALHEKMFTSLRYLLQEGKLPLNRNGAAGWVQGEYCWLVSKRTVDAIREQLIQEGHTGIPTKNSRLFDELQEHAILIPNGEKAIWMAKIADDDWSHALTLIKMPVVKLWPGEKKPEEFKGVITPLNSMSSDSTQTLSDVLPESEKLTQENKLADIELNKPAPTDALAQSNAVNDKKNAFTAYLPSSGTSYVGQTPKYEQRHESIEGQGVNHDLTDEASKPRTISINIEADQVEKPRELQDSGENTFLGWIKAGIQQGSIKVNHSRARVHIVNEGVLLVTPGIFQDCAAAINEGDWLTIQKAFLKKNLHHKDANGLNVMKYQVKGKDKKTTVNGILIPDAELLFSPGKVPQPNPHLIAIKE